MAIQGAAQKLIKSLEQIEIETHYSLPPDRNDDVVNSVRANAQVSNRNAEDIGAALKALKQFAIDIS